MQAWATGFIAASFAFFLTAGDAFGQQQQADLSQARDLATKGYAALNAKDYATAEGLFQRAESLYHAPTILLGLARAQAHRGKYVESWEDYHRIIVDGAPPTAPAAIRAAVDSAKQEISSVESRRGKAIISVVGPSQPAVPQPTVTLDGVALASAALGAERFVNPGRHVVHASASGFKDAEVTFTATEGAGVEAKVSLEPLAPVAAPAPVEVSKPPVGGPAASSPSASVGTSGTGTRRTLGWVAVSAGGVGLVVGAVTGALALSKRSSATQSPCASGPCAPGPAGAYDSNVDDFHTFGAASTVGFIVGGVLAAGGAVLIFTSHGEPSREVAVTPYLGLGDAGVTGHF